MHVTDEELILHHYDELAAPDRARVAAHLGACERCAAADARLRRVLSVVDVPVPEPAEGFERAVWAQLAPQVSRPRAVWWSTWTWTPARWAAAGAVAALLVAAFAAGRYWRPPVAPAERPTQVDAAAERAGRERLLLVAVGDHLDRTEMVLVELKHADGGDTVDISAARAQAADLVSDNRLYRQTASSVGDAAIASVLDDLERALIEVARCPAEVPRHDLETILRGIQAQDLLFKLRVVGESVREREESADARVARAVS